MISDELIKETLKSSKIIAMVGASVPKENEAVAKMRLKPSIIVMKYLLEFGYKVIPVNPFSAGKKVNGETIVEKLEDISSQIDIVNVFRPSKETPDIAKNAIKVGAKTLWLQFGIQNKEAEEISKSAGLTNLESNSIPLSIKRILVIF